jgi:TRAP-type C4-dicarboxylate transport system permease small subunit
MTANHALQIIALVLILSFAAWAWYRGYRYTHTTIRRMTAKERAVKSRLRSSDN